MVSLTLTLTLTLSDYSGGRDGRVLIATHQQV